MGLFDKFKKKTESKKEQNSEWQEMYERNKEKFRCKIDLDNYFSENKIGKMEVDILDIGEVNLPRGVRPFLSEKFDITKHKNYKLLEDFDKKNAFDIEDYISRKGKAKLNKNSVITRLWHFI